MQRQDHRSAELLLRRKDEATLGAAVGVPRGVWRWSSGVGQCVGVRATTLHEADTIKTKSLPTCDYCGVLADGQE